MIDYLIDLSLWVMIEMDNCGLGITGYDRIEFVGDF